MRRNLRNTYRLRGVPATTFSPTRRSPTFLRAAPAGVDRQGARCRLGRAARRGCFRAYQSVGPFQMARGFHSHFLLQDVWLSHGGGSAHRAARGVEKVTVAPGSPVELSPWLRYRERSITLLMLLHPLKTAPPIISISPPSWLDWNTSSQSGWSLFTNACAALPNG